MLFEGESVLFEGEGVLYEGRGVLSEGKFNICISGYINGNLNQNETVDRKCLTEFQWQFI